MLDFHVTQTLDMTIPSRDQSFECYLQKPQRFLKAIMDPRRIEEISPHHFHLQLRPLKFMMLSIQPTVTLRAEMQEDGKLHLEMTEYEVHGVEFLQDSFQIALTGWLSPHAKAESTELSGKADLIVHTEVPPALQFLPESALSGTGKTFLQSILKTIKGRLEARLVEDYTRWAQSPQETTPSTEDLCESA